MTKGLGYLIYSGLILMGSGYAQYRGWNLFDSTERAQVAPKSVRENPGIYRSIYSGYYRYSGGK